MKKILYNFKGVMFCFTFIVSFLISFIFLDMKSVRAEENKIIGYATLNASWVNLGKNWELTGGTSGKVISGESFDVLDRKWNGSRYIYYVYAHNAGIYGYISERFIIFSPVEDKSMIAQEKNGIGYATLNASWVNLGKNWELTGGTSGKVISGESFDVLDRKWNGSKYIYYVYAHNAGIYGYISERFLKYTPYADEINEYSLFRTYADSLCNPLYEYELNNIVMKGLSAAEKSGLTGIGGSYSAVLQGNVIKFVTSEVLSKLGIGKSYEERMRQETIMCLMPAIYGNSAKFANKFMQADEMFQEFASWSSFAEGEIIPYAMKPFLAKLFPDMTAREIEEVIDEFYKSKIISKLIGAASDVYDLMANIFQVYYTETALIDHVMQFLPPDSDLYKDLSSVKDERESSPLKFLKQYYFDNKFVDSIFSFISKKASSTAGGIMSAVDTAEFLLAQGAKWFSRNLSANEYIKTIYLNNYVSELEQVLYKMQEEFANKFKNGEAVTEQEIEDYEFVFNLRLESIKTFLINAKELKKENKAELQESIDKIATEYTYEKYIFSCIEIAKSKMKQQQGY